MNTPYSLYIGLMSGTSLDGVDAVLAKVDADGKTHIQGSVSAPFNLALRQELLDLQTPGHNEIHRENQAANALALIYADTVNQLLHQTQVNPDQITAIGAHGQTIRHQADLPNHQSYSHQTLNPALLAEMTRIDVIADFRSRDIAAGGHGAPLVPAFHVQQFHSANEERAVLNIGGIANLTLLPAIGEIKGFDCGPGNILLDAWIQKNIGELFDENGSWALKGSANPELLKQMLLDPFFQKPPPKSTGRDHFHLPWIIHHINHQPLSAEDIQATLLNLTAQSVLTALFQYAPSTQKLIVCGGGAKNSALMDLLKNLSNLYFKNRLSVNTSIMYGVDPQLVESLAFAWLAWAHKTKRSANLPTVTGANGYKILGACYPA